MPVGRRRIADGESLTSIFTDEETDERVSTYARWLREQFKGSLRPRESRPYAKQRVAGDLIRRAREHAIYTALALGGSLDPETRQRTYTRSLMIKTPADFWRDLKIEAAQNMLTVEEVANLYLRLGLDLVWQEMATGLLPAKG